MTGRFRRKNTIKSVFTVLAFLACGSSEVRSNTTPEYTVESIGHLGGGWSLPLLMNEAGEVAGISATRTKGEHAFLYSNGVLHDISLGGAFSRPTAMNSKGQVVGFGRRSDGATRAFLFDAGMTLDLGTLGGPSSEATGINEAGEIIGTSTMCEEGNPKNCSELRGFLWKNGRMQDLGSFGGMETVPVSINNSGQIAGHSVLSDNKSRHAFLYSAGAMLDLGTLGHLHSYAVALNSTGQVSGISVDFGGAPRAFRYTSGHMLDLRTLGGSENIPIAMNDAGEVIGLSTIAGSSEYHAYLFSNNFLLGLSLGGGSIPKSLNRLGHVVGFSQLPGVGTSHAFLYADGFIHDIGLGGNFSVAESINDSSQAVGSDRCTDSATCGAVSSRGFLRSAGVSYSLTDLISSAPKEWNVDEAYMINDRGDIAAMSNSGAVLLRPAFLPNTAPVVSPLELSPNPSPAGNIVSATGLFSDKDTADTHSATVDWGDGTVDSVLLTEAAGSGAFSPTHAYSAAGIYSVTVRVSDDRGMSGQSTQQLVVFDPSAGFVTGGGWIISPHGAYVADATLAGKATFAFVSKYTNGAGRPSGKTEFQFHAGKFNFFSDEYDWLVVAGARAQFKGSGRVNGAGDYGFLLTAIDGTVNGSVNGDRFRIKIWSKSDGRVVYDNQIESDEDATPTTALGGGNISIHK